MKRFHGNLEKDIIDSRSRLAKQIEQRSYTKTILKTLEKLKKFLIFFAETSSY